ncbi:uncharacterized protein LOC143246821 isoform X1 [Tachypleus tridentatus]|uniref:uncharacterized protein LOC143246821 isoform X1 n=1 Tax=Tachypleus tridentatus TaxID=6853 RepID=UPI003FD61A09
MCVEFHERIDSKQWITTGATFRNVWSSKFCQQPLLNLFHRLKVRVQALRKDDILVVVVKDILSRFIVGSMYMLANLFSMERATDTPQVWMFGCFVSTQSNNAVQSHLKFFMEKLVQLQKTPETTILERSLFIHLLSNGTMFALRTE